MLRRCHLRQSRILAPGLHAQERDERLNLLLDRLEAGQRVELREQLVQRPRRLLAAQEVDVELLADLQANLLAKRPQRLQWIRHDMTVPVGPAPGGAMISLSYLMVQPINDSMELAGEPTHRACCASRASFGARSTRSV